VLIAVSGGLAAYGLWKLGLSVFGTGLEGGGGRSLTDRFGNAIAGISYLALFVVSVRVLAGHPENQARQERSTTAGVLGWPGGRLLVGAAGACLIAAAAYQTYGAVRGNFANDNKLSKMTERERNVFMQIGRVGLTARALVLGLIGYFLIRTAIDFKPSAGIGIDGALAQVHQQPCSRSSRHAISACELPLAVTWRRRRRPGRHGSGAPVSAAMTPTAAAARRV
jgi:hypothetical protein